MNLADSSALALAAGSKYVFGFWHDWAPMNTAKSRVLAVQQRQEAEVGQLELAAVGDGDLGRALHGHVAVVGREGVDRQALDLAAALDAAGAGHPAVLGEGVGDAGGVGPGGVHPQVLVVVRAVDDLLEVELLDRA